MRNQFVDYNNTAFIKCLLNKFNYDVELSRKFWTNLDFQEEFLLRQFKLPYVKNTMFSLAMHEMPDYRFYLQHHMSANFSRGETIGKGRGVFLEVVALDLWLGWLLAFTPSAAIPVHPQWMWNWWLFTPHIFDHYTVM